MDQGYARDQISFADVVRVVDGSTMQGAFGLLRPIARR
jgi:hypothetical protein